MKRIFLTGASGCIGHYIAEALIEETEHELFLLVRNPAKLQFEYRSRPGVTVLQGDLREIEKFGNLLKTVNVAILAATAWGGTETREVNVAKTIATVNLLDPNVCEQVLYFSTASLLDRNNQLLPEAKQYGIDYIRSKYDCYVALSQLAIAPAITTLFPTLVFGGDTTKPYSHISAGFADVVKWIDLIRWFKADGSFHFIHARDIAQVVRHLVDHPSCEKRLVLGNPRLTVERAIAEICAALNKKIYLRFPLSVWLANVFITIFRIQMDPWSRFSFNYRHFTHQNVVNPARFGLTPYCATVADLIQTSKIGDLESICSRVPQTDSRERP
ncbi:MAG: NAD-dependent epimerase/dehydratase family protein [Cyanophyceae cyanobacterium]